MSHGGGGAIFWYCQEQYFLAVPSYLTKNNTSFQHQEFSRNTVFWYCIEEYSMQYIHVRLAPVFLVDACTGRKYFFFRYEGTAWKYCSVQYREK